MWDRCLAGREQRVHCDTTGRIEREVKIAGEPEALVRYFDELELSAIRTGSGPGPCRNGCMPGLCP